MGFNLIFPTYRYMRRKLIHRGRGSSTCMCVKNNSRANSSELGLLNTQRPHVDGIKT